MRPSIVAGTGGLCLLTNRDSCAQLWGMAKTFTARITPGPGPVVSHGCVPKIPGSFNLQPHPPSGV